MNIDLKKLHDNFSLITVSSNKVPNFTWKPQQSKKLTFEEFLKRYNYKGGIIKKDGKELPATENIGIVTGFEDLEVIDVDLKVFPTAKEKTAFWNEFVGYLQDNILDFWEKFPVYKTKSDGYHILYKNKNAEGNQKLAKLEGHHECVIETRGVGGYVFVYPEKNIGKLTYFDVDYVSDEDREILFSFSRMYDFKEEKEYKVKKHTDTKFEKGKLTPWEDYNSKTNILNLISDEFEIKHRMESAKKYVVKRFGSDSVHSGYVYKDSMGMFLYSTGTRYPECKLLKAFDVYTYKYHNGDYSESASKLYSEGFGDRAAVVIPETIKEDVKVENVEFPLKVFPENLQLFLIASEDKLMLNIEIMASSFLWLMSVIIGNSYKVKIKNGWYESPIIFLALVGQSGLGKTPALNQIINPLKKINQRKVEEYFEEYERYEEYIEATKKSKNNSHVPVPKPKRKQILATDTTIEALIHLHNESKNSIGINKDELDGWFKDMNRYNDGSDKQQWLSIWSNESIVVNRLTRNDLYIASPFISVIGGIQPEILDSHFTHENVSSGFIDRFLFCYPEKLEAQKFNKDELNEKIIEYYENNIISMYRFVKDKHQLTDKNDIKPYIVNLKADAYEVLVKVLDEYTDRQNSENEPEMFKSMLAKIKTYVPRLALILHFTKQFFEGRPVLESIEMNTVLDAYELTEYFISQFKRIKVDSLANREVYNIKKGKANENNTETFTKIFKQIDPSKINKSQLAKQFNVSRVTIDNWIKKIQDDNKK